MTSRYQVEITTVAERDVEEIWEYIVHDNTERANSFILDLEEIIAQYIKDRSPLGFTPMRASSHTNH